MPPSETMCISLGNWVIAFYVVYGLAAFALVSALGVVIDWAVSTFGTGRSAVREKLSHAASRA